MWNHGSLRHVLALAVSVIVGSAQASDSLAERPWANRIDKPFCQIFLEQDYGDPSVLHHGIDIPPYEGDMQDVLTPMAEGFLLDCNEDFVIPEAQRYVHFVDNLGQHYLYRHIGGGSVARQLGVPCDSVNLLGPYAVSVGDHIAESQALQDLHIETVGWWPFNVDSSNVYNPLLTFPELLTPDANYPYACDCEVWSYCGDWCTVYFRAYDKTWNNGSFKYDPDYDWPDGYRTGVHRAWVIDSWIDPYEFPHSEVCGEWQLDYYWLINFNDLFYCADPNYEDCYYVLQFERGQEPGEHHYTVYVQDYSGKKMHCDFGVGIDREISDFAATAGDQVVDLSWDASSFDSGVMFFVDRSIDGGISYNHCLQDEEGYPLFRVFSSDSTYTMPDSSVEFNFPYFYRIYDTESGPGPDHYWEMDSLMLGEIGGLADPPPPTTAPQISFKSMATVGDSGFVSVWFDGGTDWAGWYLVAFDQDGPPYTQAQVHFGSREAIVAGLPTGATYHLAAKGESPIGSTDFSNEVVFTVLPATTLLSAEVVDATSIIATWSGVAAADGYDLICTKIYPSPQDTVIDAGTDTTWRVDDLEEYEQYCVRVKCRDAYGNQAQSSNHEYVVTEGYGGIEDIVAVGCPASDRLFQNYPNPFNPETKIPCQVSSRGSVHIAVYDVEGKLVRVLVSGPRPPGSYLARWDGKDDKGLPVPPGVYFARFSTESVTETRKMVLAK